MQVTDLAAEPIQVVSDALLRGHIKRGTAISGEPNQINAFVVNTICGTSIPKATDFLIPAHALLEFRQIQSGGEGPPNRREMEQHAGGA